MIMSSYHQQHSISLTSVHNYDSTHDSAHGGLSPIFEDIDASHGDTQIPEVAFKEQWVPIDDIQPGGLQPRQYFGEAEIEKLANTFKNSGFHGVLNIRPLGPNQYELVAGERRWRAAKRAGLKKVLCLIYPFSDEEALQFSLVENLKRVNLSKLEETLAILRLIEVRYGLGQMQVTKIIRTEGHPDKRSRCDVAPSQALQQIEAILNSFDIELQTFRTRNLRSLELPHELKQAHLENKLSWSVTLELNKIKDESARQTLLNEILKGDPVSFRWVQQKVRALKAQTSKLGQDKPQSVSLGKRLSASAKRLDLIESKLSSAQRTRLEAILRELDELLPNQE